MGVAAKRARNESVGAVVSGVLEHVLGLELVCSASQRARRHAELALALHVLLGLLGSDPSTVTPEGAAHLPEHTFVLAVLLQLYQAQVIPGASQRARANAVRALALLVKLLVDGALT